MPLMPLDSEDVPEGDGNGDNFVTLTGIDVSGGDREQILEALKLNRKLLYEPQPGANVDESAVRRTIDALLDQLHECEDPEASSQRPTQS